MLGGNGHGLTLMVLDMEARVAPEHTLVVEDSAAGLEAATASGAYVASVRSGCGSEGSRFLGAYPDLTSLLRRLGVPPR